jgi:glycosyltransferase involved in cell wall biosynthesis
MSKPAAAAPLRVLHLHSTFEAGGKERRSVALMNRFHRGVVHSVVSAEPGKLGARTLVAKNVKVGYPFGFPALAGKFSIKRMKALARAMQDFDLVLTYNWGAMDAVMAHALFGPAMKLPPLVHHEDGFNADEAVKLKTTRNWYRMVALSRASALVVPSRRLEYIALNTWRQPRGRVHRIANGIETTAYGRKAKADALPRVIKRPGELWLGAIAGLRPVKNLPALVRAFAPLPVEWHLVILGEGPEREAILAQAIELEVGDRVHLPGFVPDPARAIALFDLFALSSDSEQFPLSVVEAMAAGLTVVAPAVGDIADIVAEENAPYIVPPGDEAALHGALASLVDEPALRARIGAANRARARAEFDEAGMAGRYAGVYAAALGRTSFP